MALFDKAKELAGQAQRGWQQGQEKVEELRRRRELHDLAAALGWEVYRGRQRGGVDEAEVARLSARMAALEAELPPAASSAPPPGQPRWSPAPPLSDPAGAPPPAAGPPQDG